MSSAKALHTVELLYYYHRFSHNGFVNSNTGCCSLLLGVTSTDFILLGWLPSMLDCRCKNSITVINLWLYSHYVLISWKNTSLEWLYGLIWRHYRYIKSIPCDFVHGYFLNYISKYLCHTSSTMFWYQTRLRLVCLMSASFDSYCFYQTETYVPISVDQMITPMKDMPWKYFWQRFSC